MYLSTICSARSRTAAAYLAAANGTDASQRFSQSPSVPGATRRPRRAFLELRAGLRAGLRAMAGYTGRRARRRVDGHDLCIGDQRLAYAKGDQWLEVDGEGRKLRAMDDHFQPDPIVGRRRDVVDLANGFFAGHRSVSAGPAVTWKSQR